MEVAKDSLCFINKINETFNLQSKGGMDYYFLEYDIRRKKNGSWAKYTKTSSHEAIAKLEQAMGNVPLAKTPTVSHDHPEEEISKPLNPLRLHHYQMMIGCLNWIATLGRMCIACHASLFSHFCAGTRGGNLARALRIVGCLKKTPNLEKLYDPTEKCQTNNGRTASKKELIVRYADAVE